MGLPAVTFDRLHRTVTQARLAYACEDIEALHRALEAVAAELGMDSLVESPEGAARVTRSQLARNLAEQLSHLLPGVHRTPTTRLVAQTLDVPIGDREMLYTFAQRHCAALAEAGGGGMFVLDVAPDTAHPHLHGYALTDLDNRALRRAWERVSGAETQARSVGMAWHGGGSWDPEINEAFYRSIRRWLSYCFKYVVTPGFRMPWRDRVVAASGLFVDAWAETVDELELGAKPAAAPPGIVEDGLRRCEACGELMPPPPLKSARAKYCNVTCKQKAYRARQRGVDARRIWCDMEDTRRN